MAFGFSVPTEKHFTAGKTHVHTGSCLFMTKVPSNLSIQKTVYPIILDKQGVDRHHWRAALVFTAFALYIQLPAFTKHGHYALYLDETIHLVEVRTLTLVLSPFFRTVCIW